MNNRLSDFTLSSLESIARDNGYDYPIAWALSFLSENEYVIVDALRQAGNTDLAIRLQDLVAEIDNG